MKTSQRGIDLIKKYEGFSSTPYYCPANKLSVGYGHVVLSGETFAEEITEADADKLLREDLHFSEKGVQTYTHVPLTQGQFDALVSFTYNLGVGALRDSTLLKKVNARDVEGAAAEFDKWVHGGGRVLPGLIKRRAAEAALFRGEA